MPTESKRKSRRTGSPRTRRTRGRRWSAKVTRTSHAMDLEKGIFQSNDPKKIARSVKRSSKRSRRRKSNPYRSAASMISFYENRGGTNLSPAKKRTLQRAKQQLKREFGR